MIGFHKNVLKPNYLVLVFYTNIPNNDDMEIFSSMENMKAHSIYNIALKLEYAFIHRTYSFQHNIIQILLKS